MLLVVMGAEPTWAKMITVVDEDVGIYNMDDVMWAILTRSRRDEFVRKRIPGADTVNVAEYIEPRK